MKAPRVSMEARASNRLNLVDLMILTAAAALGIAAWRGQLRLGRLPGAWWAIDAQTGSVWFAIILALALVIIQLRQGQTEWRRLSRRPGFTASVGSLSALAMLLVILASQKVVYWIHRGVPLRFTLTDLTEQLFNLMTMVVPPTVAATWVLLLIGGRWRWGRNPIDRLGVLLGFYWITWNIVAELLVFGV